MYYKNKSESGRSMVEMLGVLAVIGVLSVSGITGYKYAMDMHYVNKVVQAWNIAALEMKEHYYNQSLLNKSSHITKKIEFNGGYIHLSSEFYDDGQDSIDYFAWMEFIPDLQKTITPAMCKGISSKIDKDLPASDIAIACSEKEDYVYVGKTDEMEQEPPIHSIAFIDN